MTSPKVVCIAKVVCIGLDAADSTTLLEGCENGAFPTFRRLRDSGAWGIVDSPPGFGSGALWSSFATGVSPARHGRYFYRQVWPGSYETRPFTDDDYRGTTVWEHLSRAGRRVAVIDMPSCPLATDLNGVMAADWITHDLVYGELRSGPESFGAELVRDFGACEMRKCDRPGGWSAAQAPELLARLRQQIVQREACVRHHLTAGEWDFFATAFSEPHCVGHQCWHLRDPSHPQHDPGSGRVGDPLENVYGSIDAAIGKILADVGADTTVIVFSAISMGPNYTGNHVLDEVLRRLEGVRATPRLASTVGLKRMLKQHLPLEWRRRGRALKMRLEESALSADRPRRRAFALPHNDLAGAIRINLVGREPNGLVAPGEECDRFVAQLREDLLQVRNLDTGDPLVADVVRVADTCQGDSLDAMPDLFVLWHRDAPPDRIGSEKIGEVVYRHRGNRTGDHRPESLFFATGPGVRPGRLDHRSIHDFAPTIGALLGVPIAETDGRVIDALVGKAVLD